ncbi:MAG: hypothetical protein ACRD5M_12470 [Candidatus Acidiferrales bacterium]
MGFAHPPLEYLLTSSIVSLESFELSRLNSVANLKKEFRQILDEWIEAEIEARLSRWILECRRLADAEPRPSAPPLVESSARILQAGVEPAGVDSENVDRVQPSDRLALLAETRGSADLSATAQVEQPAPHEECAAGALRWLEKFARTQGESLHCRSSNLIEQHSAGPGSGTETHPGQALFDWHAARALPLQDARAGNNPTATSASPSDGQEDQVRKVVAGEIDPAKASAPRKIDRHGQRSISQAPVAPRPPAPQIPLFRSRIANAS